MEIDSAKQGLRLSKKELDQCRKNKLCFKYGKEGHQASFYCQNQKKPNSKGQGQGRLLGKQLHTAMQINMVNSKEWNLPDKDRQVANTKYSNKQELIGNRSKREDEKYNLTALKKRRITKTIC